MSDAETEPIAITGADIIEVVRRLKHALGVCTSKHWRRWGFRNYYCVSADTDPTWEMACSLGLAVRAKPGVYRATPDGARVAGLTGPQIARLFQGGT